MITILVKEGYNKMTMLFRRITSLEDIKDIKKYDKLLLKIFNNEKVLLTVDEIKDNIITFTENHVEYTHPLYIEHMLEDIGIYREVYLVR